VRNKEDGIGGSGRMIRGNGRVGMIENGGREIGIR
jgi:hypothetical protein